ncbi:MAG: transcription termination/antitermination protein NusA [SAR324 cluster bacterium]|nr:transcription termination/antitermination protein NusA [SAR324 cluster bacterium]
MAVSKENLMDVIHDLAKEKGLDREELIKIVAEAIAAAARKKLTQYDTIEAEVNQKSGQIELFHYKRVAQFPTDPVNEILLEDALAMDETAEEGDEVEYEIDQKEFNRIAQSARQLIFKKIKEAEREMIYNTFNERKGEILTGSVIRTEQGGRIAIDFNRVEAYLFKREQIPGERFEAGDHIRVYLMDVTNDPKQPSQLIVSRTHPGFLIKLFEMEVPEVYDGIVEIINATREPGKRAKVAVYTSDSDVDPVGACVGMRGSRVQSIVSELRGEKIDIVRWSDDLPTYLENAMSPAEIERMEIDEEQREINVWVEQDQLSLAIGRQGQNVRLASKLIRYKINASPLEERSSISIEDQIALELGKDRAANEALNEEAEEPTETSEETATEETTDQTEEVSQEMVSSEEDDVAGEDAAGGASEQNSGDADLNDSNQNAEEESSEQIKEEEISEEDQRSAAETDVDPVSEESVENKAD